MLRSWAGWRRRFSSSGFAHGCLSPVAHLNCLSTSCYSFIRYSVSRLLGRPEHSPNPAILAVHTVAAAGARLTRLAPAQAVVRLCLDRSVGAYSPNSKDGQGNTGHNPQKCPIVVLCAPRQSMPSYCGQLARPEYSGGADLLDLGRIHYRQPILYWHAGPDGVHGGYFLGCCAHCVQPPKSPTKNGRAASRLSFAKITDTLTVPDLLALQTESFDWLVGNDIWKTRVEEGVAQGRTDLPTPQRPRRDLRRDLSDRRPRRDDAALVHGS